MHKNFVISSPISIDFDGEYFDLHNDFSFSRLEFNVFEKKCLLVWIQIADATQGDKRHLEIVFSGVELLKVHERDNVFPASEDQQLSFLGYLHPDEVTTMDGFLTEESFRNDFHIIFCFESGAAIKISAHDAFARATRASKA